MVVGIRLNVAVYVLFAHLLKGEEENTYDW
jgi:hypothetical protein